MPPNPNPIKDWVEKKVRRHLMRMRGHQGFGWKRKHGSRTVGQCESAGITTVPCKLDVPILGPTCERLEVQFPGLLNPILLETYRFLFWFLTDMISFHINDVFW